MIALIGSVAYGCLKSRELIRCSSRSIDHTIRNPIQHGPKTITPSPFIQGVWFITEHICTNIAEVLLLLLLSLPLIAAHVLRTILRCTRLHKQWVVKLYAMYTPHCIPPLRVSCAAGRHAARTRRLMNAHRRVRVRAMRAVTFTHGPRRPVAMYWFYTSESCR